MIRNNCAKVSGSYQCRADSGGQDPRGKCRDKPTIGATFLLETFANSLQKPRGQKAKLKQVVGSLSRQAEPPAASGGWGRAEGLPDRRSLVNTQVCSRDHQRATSGGGQTNAHKSNMVFPYLHCLPEASLENCPSPKLSLQLPLLIAYKLINRYV